MTLIKSLHNIVLKSQILPGYVQGESLDQKGSSGEIIMAVVLTV